MGTKMERKRLHFGVSLAAIGTCFLVGTFTACIAQDISDAEFIKQRNAELARITGSPTTRTVRTVVKYVERVVVDQKAVQAKYLEGREEGRREVLAQIRKAPPAASILATADEEVLKIVQIKGKPRVIHHQHLKARFVDGRNQPRAGMRVIPVILQRDADGKPLPEKAWPAVVADTEGRVEVRDLPVPCAVRWELPQEGVRFTEVSEWSFQDPQAAQVAVTEYSKDATIAWNLPPLVPNERIARKPTGLLQLATKELRGLLLALAPKSKAIPRGKPTGKPPARQNTAKPAVAPKIQAEAESLLNAARSAYEDGAENLKIADRELYSLDSSIRTRAVAKLREAIAAAEAASRLLRFKDARACDYQARAVYWLPEKGSKELALRKLQAGLKLLPRNPLLLKALEELRNSPDEADRIRLVARKRLANAEAQREKDGLTDGTRKLLEEVIREATQTIVLNNDLADAYLLAGRARLGLDQVKEAKVFVEAAVVRFPLHIELKDLLGHILKVLEGCQDPIVAHHIQNAEAIVLVRNIADFTISGLPSDTSLHVPAALLAGKLGQPGKSCEVADETRQEMHSLEELPVERRAGKVHFQLPVYALGNREFPIRADRETGEAVWEGLLTIDARKNRPDPYATENLLEAPKLNLIRIKKLDLKAADVLVTKAALEEGLNIAFDDLLPGQKPPKKPKVIPAGKVLARRTMETMQSWWEETPDYAIHFRVSPTARIFDEDRKGQPLKDRAELEGRITKSTLLADVLRLKSAAAGNVAGITVGATEGTIIRTLGEPEERGTDGGRAALAYLDRGLLFRLQGDRVAEIDVLRSAQLLRSGTTAFAPRTLARVFLDEFETYPEARFPTAQAFKRFLDRTGVIRMVQAEREADYVVSFRMGERRFLRGPERKVREVEIPASVEFIQNATFSIREKSSGDVREEPIRVTIGQDFSNDLKSVRDYDENARNAKSPRQRKAWKFLADAVFDSVQGKQETIRTRGPRAAEQDVYERVADRLYAVIDLQSRVESIDYDRAELTIPLGKQHNIDPGAAFDLFVNGERLTLSTNTKNDEDGETREREYYLAEVIRVGETSSKCKVVRFRNRQGRRANKFEDSWDRSDAAFMTHRLPQPRTGVVSVRARAALPVEEGAK